MAKIKFRQGASFEEYCPFPVGTCIFCTYDPNAVWPGTTWHRHGEGHYLVSAGDTYKVNNTYGSNTHVLTIDEMPSHHHQLLAVEDGGNVATWGLGVAYSVAAQQQVAGRRNRKYRRRGAAHNNMPLSVAVPLWERTGDAWLPLGYNHRP